MKAGDIVRNGMGHLGVITAWYSNANAYEVETKYGLGLYASFALTKVRPQWFWRLFV